MRGEQSVVQGGEGGDALGGCTRVASAAVGNRDGWPSFMETFEDFMVWTEGGWGKSLYTSEQVSDMTGQQGI